MEQKEKQEQQNKYEINIAKHQEWVRRLAVEVSTFINHYVCNYTVYIMIFYYYRLIVAMLFCNNLMFSIHAC